MSRSIAAHVHARRMAEGGSPEAFARRHGLDPDRVRLVEAGEPCADDEVVGLCAALSLPVERHVGGMPDGPLRAVEPVDDRHAALMARLAGAAAGPGWMVTPDVACHDRVTGWTRAREGWRRVLDVSLLVAQLGTGLTAFAVIVAGIMCFSLVADQALGWHSPDPGPATDVAWLGLTWLTRCAPAALCWAGIRTVARRLGWASRSGTYASWGAREDLARHAFVVTHEGLAELRVDGTRVVRTDLSAFAIDAVEVTEEDADHVTVVVSHAGADVRMAWLPGSVDLDAAIASWRSRIAARRAPHGQAYVVPEAPLLVGRG